MGSSSLPAAASRRMPGRTIPHYDDIEKEQHLVVHSRQCVGRTLIHLLLSALIHPPKTRRHGKRIAHTPVSSIIAISRSRSNGAVRTGYHIMSIKTLGAATVWRCAVV
jgi:hypothetical protein